MRACSKSTVTVSQGYSTPGTLLPLTVVAESHSSCYAGTLRPPALSISLMRFGGLLQSVAYSEERHTDHNAPVLWTRKLADDLARVSSSLSRAADCGTADLTFGRHGS